LATVIKVGGSLAVDPDALRGLCVELSLVAERFKVVVVPGGGQFADMVRKIDEQFGLSSGASHRMALLGMDQFGLLLSELIPSCRVASSLSVISGLGSSGRVVVLLPARLVFRARSLVASWDVTSDSVAGYVAGRLAATKIVLVTDVDGVFSADPKVENGAKLLAEVSASGLLELGMRTSVDRFLPRLLLKFGLDCFVVNGRFPERVARVLAGESVICTHILAK